jgi:glyoxylase-like metal-dependent hydrolase (beta-lactamase superfamily II)
MSPPAGWHSCFQSANATSLVHVSEFTEVGERVWVARFEWYDVNVSVVEGEAGLVVVDTHASTRAAHEVISALRTLSSRPVVGVVNTHWHFDHLLGNHAFRVEYDAPPITAHESAARALAEHGEEMRAEAAERAGDRGAQILETEIVLPDRTFSSVTSIDLGDRALELVHPGRGHTDGDLVVRLEDARSGADVLLAGDLVEESGAPAYGGDSFPMDWPLSLDLVLQLIGTDTVVVPGHGSPVDREFVEEQRAAIGVVAETIRDLAGRGVRVDEALAAAQWPYPSEVLGQAVRRGYEQLPSSQKRLPLL